MPFDLGATARLTAECRDPGGTLTTASGVTVTVTLPDGTTASPTASESGTGQYRVDYPTAQAGRHVIRWQFTSPVDAHTDSFDVREAAPPGILSLSDAKQYLRLTSTAEDDELRSWIESITAGIEGTCGPVVVRTATERVDFRCASSIALRAIPVIELVSVTALLADGTGYATAELDLDPGTGIVRRLDGGMLVGPLVFATRVGRLVVPASLTAAARIILRHLWQTRQGPQRPQLGTGDFDVNEPTPHFGYAIPNRALQLMEPYRLPPGVG
ncbi:phage gp6-like head-tail connector protein [Streptomyces sp. NBC_00250]|uniref:head-tail connector protein n=1 Tax=Streptomyces sp. NBC_00250 TaxID=2903641 RepID=UPI002E2A4782|nr:head-tail connector protein [Streptomyces sp. NBC_00250]